MTNSNIIDELSMQDKTQISKYEMLKIPAEEISDPSQFNPTPLVSVVMMTRNHQDYIRQAVESVLNQEVNFPIEILIGEDFSTDNTRQECEKLQLEYPHLIRLIVATENVGITPNFLRLVSRARGKYIALLEGDDYWIHPQKLSLQVELMETHLEYSWCAGKTEGRTFWVKEKEFYTLSDIIEKYIFHTSTFLFRSELLNSYPNFPNAVCWDAMLSVFLAEKGQCGFINQFVSFYRRHTGGLYTGDSIFNRIALAQLFTDTINPYTKYNYEKIIHEKELWVCSMETAINIENFNLKMWFNNIQLLRTELPRLVKVIPLKFFAFSITILIQPFVFSYLSFRRNLALRSRFAKLFNTFKSYLPILK
jgi:glycosyltransferase involved in cell wall biosynthesis